MSEKKTGKVAFLILAHTDPTQLKRLLNSLDYPGFDLYVHVDAKSNPEEFGLSELSLQHSRLFVMDNRRSIFWGDISILEATLDMYRRAYETDSYDRFVTLSGLCYPLLSNADIKKYLEEESREIIMGGVNKKLYKVVYNYHMDNKSIPFRVYRRLIRLLRIPYQKPFLQLSDGRVFVVFFAPQWHALSREFVAYLLKTLEEHPEIKEYFRVTFAPDELLIPTVLFNSPFGKNAISSTVDGFSHYNTYMVTHYLNYDPFIEVFDETRFDDMVASGRMFFRKARTGKSDKLMDMLDQRRNEKSLPYREGGTAKP